MQMKVWYRLTTYFFFIPRVVKPFCFKNFFESVFKFVPQFFNSNFFF